MRDNTVSWRHVKKTNRNPIPEFEDGKLYNALQFKKFFDKDTIWSPFLTKKNTLNEKFTAKKRLKMDG